MQRRTPESGLLDKAVYLLVAFAMLFNPLLSLVNAHVTGISGTIVTGIQLAITFAAIGLIVLRGGPRVSIAFPALFFAFLLLCLIAGALAGSTDLKTIYDVALLCIFIALGSTLRIVPTGFLKWLLAISLAVAIFEFVAPDLYVMIFDPLGYSSNTRGWVAELLADTFTDGAGLAVGAVRGDGQAWLGASESGHRVGGVFLEPLSQGYFAVIMAIFLGHAYQKDFLRRTIATLLCLIMAMLSDTRVASMLIVFFYISAPFVRLVPAYLAMAIPPLGLGVGLFVFWLTDPQMTSEFIFRLTLTFGVILQSSIFNVVFGGIDMTYAADSGVVTILSRAGLLGLLIFFAVASGAVSSKINPPAILHFVMIYLVVTSLFGAAFLSIKTAALLGLMIGATGVGAFRPYPPRRQRKSYSAAPQLLINKTNNGFACETDRTPS